jgi:tricorn protease
MKKIFITQFLLFVLMGINAQTAETPDALMLRFPDVSAKEITFVYAEDVWTVSKDGGIARRITSTPGIEAFPRFSPDGKTIAFSGNYGGNKDVYTISNVGSNLKRLTYHPDGENVIDWQPNGEKVLFASRRKSPSNRFNQFYTVDVNGGPASQLPLFYAEFGSYNQDGTKLAYQYLSRGFRNG